MLEENTVLAERYVVQALIGQGGTADVYGIYDTNLKVHRVLKVGARPDPESARRWLRTEFEFLSNARSPLLPGCFEWVEEVDGLVLEYCPGNSLEQVQPVDHPTWALAVTTRLLALLEAVHSHSHVYRDLKPTNVLVPKPIHEPWKLLDHGAVCPTDSQGEALSTPGYAAPEVAAGSVADPSADFYSLGCILQSLSEVHPSLTSPIIGALVDSLTSATPGDRPTATVLSGLLSDTWTVEAWRSPGAICQECFQPLAGSTDVILRECACQPHQIDLGGLIESGDRLVNWLETSDKPEAAAWVLERTRGLKALSDRDRIQLARLHYSSGRAEEAIGILADGSEQRGVVAGPLLRYLYEARGGLAAIQHIRDLRGALPDSPNWIRNAAQILAREGLPGEAETLLRAGLQRNPNDGPLHWLLAAQLPSGPEKSEHMSRAASGDPPESKAVQLVVDRLASEDRLEQAIPIARRAMERSPRDRKLRRLVARLSLGQQQAWPRLERDLRSWLREGPDDPLLEHLISLYVQSERWSLLSSSDLPRASSKAASGLRNLAQIIASRRLDPGKLDRLASVPWEEAVPSSWIGAVCEVVALATRDGATREAGEWLQRLPPSFSPFMAELRSLIHGA